jgi:hypothetical protein
MHNMDAKKQAWTEAVMASLEGVRPADVRPGLSMKILALHKKQQRDKVIYMQPTLWRWIAVTLIVATLVNVFVAIHLSGRRVPNREEEIRLLAKTLAADDLTTTSK